MRASKASSISAGKVSEWRSVFDRHLPVLPEGAAGRPAGGGELSGRRAAAAGRLRAAEPAELRAEAGGPGEGAAHRGPAQGLAVGEPALGAAQVGRRKDETLTFFFFKYRKAFKKNIKIIVVFVHVWFSKMVELQELQGTNRTLMEELQCLRAAYQKEVRRREVQDGDAGSHEVVIRASVPPLDLSSLLHSSASVKSSWISTKQAYQW